MPRRQHRVTRHSSRSSRVHGSKRRQRDRRLRARYSRQGWTTCVYLMISLAALGVATYPDDSPNRRLLLDTNSLTSKGIEAMNRDRATSLSINENFLSFLKMQSGKQNFTALVSDSRLRSDLVAYKGGSCDDRCRIRLKKLAQQQWGSTWRSRAEVFAGYFRSGTISAREQSVPHQ